MSSFFRTIDVSDPAFECEGLRHVTVKSAALRRRAELTLWIPDNAAPGLPLVILMHGVYGSHWAWKGGAGTVGGSSSMRANPGPFGVPEAAVTHSSAAALGAFDRCHGILTAGAAGNTSGTRRV